MNIFRIITGFIVSFIGFVLLVLSFLVSYFFLMYAIPLVIVGVFIIFNTKEDEIERIKK